MDTQIFTLESHDFVELEEALGAWNHRYRQISPGAFYGRFLHTQNDVLGVLPKPLGARHSLPGGAEGNHNVRRYIDANQ